MGIQGSIAGSGSVLRAQMNSLYGIERPDGIEDGSREGSGLLLASALEGKGHAPAGERAVRGRERGGRGRGRCEEDVANVESWAGRTREGER